MFYDWLTIKPRIVMEPDSIMPDFYCVTVNQKALLECDGLLEWAEGLGFSFEKVRPYHKILTPTGEHNDIYKFCLSGRPAVYFKLKWGGDA